MKIWSIELFDNEGKVFSGSGFLSKEDAEKYIKENPSKENQEWIITGKEGIKLDSDRHEFFKFFNLSEKEITEDIRFSLEAYLCNTFYENPPTIINGEEYENIGQYTISYYCDQWWACGLNKTVKIGDKYYLEEIARGEGDTPVDALCSLIILKNDIIENIEYMKELFNE